MSNSKEIETTAELKAKQILSEFEGRMTMIERMNARLRPLRPPVCTSRRLFDYFELPDPYHPLDYNRPYKPEIGPSKLILGENRRPVAPHAKVPELKPRIESEKPKAPQAFRPQGVPAAATRDPSATPAPPRPPQQAVQPKPNQKPEFGQQKGHAVAKLPVRPDLGDLSSASNAVPSKPGETASPSINRSIPKPKATGQRSKTGNMRMRRSTITNTQPVVKPLNPSALSTTPDASSNESVQSQEAASINRSPNAASGGGGLDDLFGFGNQEGRMKMPRAKTRSTPQKSQAMESNIPPTASQDEAPPVLNRSVPTPTPPPAAPINRSPNAASGGGGLDDLFGFGNQEGRMKIPRSTKKSLGDQSTQSSASNTRPIYSSNPVQNPSGEPPSTDGKK